LQCDLSPKLFCVEFERGQVNVSIESETDKKAREHEQNSNLRWSEIGFGDCRNRFWRLPKSVLAVIKIQWHWTSHTLSQPNLLATKFRTEMCGVQSRNEKCKKLFLNKICRLIKITLQILDSTKFEWVRQAISKK